MRYVIGWMLLWGMWGQGLLFGQTTSPDTVPFASQATLFSLHRSQQHWLRLDLLQLVQQVEGGYLQGRVALAYEHKLRPAWSLLAEWMREYELRTQRHLPQRSLRDEMSLTVGTRYYYHLRRDLAEGAQANNFSANYVGAYLGSRFHTPNFGPQQAADHPWYTSNLSLSVLSGVQRRLFRFGFFDLAFGVRLAYGDQGFARFVFPTYVEDGWQLLPVGQVRIGLGL